MFSFKRLDDYTLHSYLLFSLYFLTYVYFHQGDRGPAGRDGLDGAAGVPVRLSTPNNDQTSN